MAEPLSSPSSANREDNVIEGRGVLQQFNGESPLTRHDSEVIKGMDKDTPLPLKDLFGNQGCLSEILTFHDDLRPHFRVRSIFAEGV